MTPAAARGRLAGIVLVVASALVGLGGCGASRDLARGDFDPHTGGVLRVATTLPAPGFWNGADPGAVDGGFEWGLAVALADRFDLRLEIVAVPFTDIVEGRLGDADLAIAQVSIDDRRGEHLDFSAPYYETAPAVLAADGLDVTDLATAKEQRWVVVDGTTHVAYLSDVVRPDDAATVVPDDAAAVAAVLAGEADAALLDLPTALVLVAGTAGVDVVARFPVTERYGVALPDGSRRNVEAVDAAVRGFDADGTLAALDERWLRPAFGRDPAALPVIRTAGR